MISPAEQSKLQHLVEKLNSVTVIRKSPALECPAVSISSGTVAVIVLGAIVITIVLFVGLSLWLHYRRR